MVTLHLHLQVPLSLHSWAWPLGAKLVGFLSTIYRWCTVLMGTKSGNMCGFTMLVHFTGELKFDVESTDAMFLSIPAQR